MKKELQVQLFFLYICITNCGVIIFFSEVISNREFGENPKLYP